MLTKNPISTGQIDMFRPKLSRIISESHSLVVLAKEIDWTGMYEALLPYYSEIGRGSIPPRKIVGMLMLKRMFNESDESVVARWIENPYWQYFTGEDYFQKDQPFDPSEFVHFRNRLGEAGLEMVLSYTVRLHAEVAKDKQVLVDTTVQEKNITFPTDTKLAKRIIDKCVKKAKANGVQLRRTYKKELKQLMKDQYNSTHPRRRATAKKAQKRIKTIAKILVRELRRKLPDTDYVDRLDFYDKVLHQERGDKKKIYSLHEPNVSCIAKGKAHKKYEFGNKVSIVKGLASGVITSAKSYQGNPHDSKTIQQSLEQSQRVTKLAGTNSAQIAIADRGYRGVEQINGVQVIIPSSGIGKSIYQKAKERKQFRKRAGIEPIIGHLKHDHRMIRNFLKGITGDYNNALLAAIGFNLKKRLNKIDQHIMYLFAFLQNYLTLSTAALPNIRMSQNRTYNTPLGKGPF